MRLRVTVKTQVVFIDDVLSIPSGAIKRQYTPPKLYTGKELSIPSGAIKSYIQLVIEYVK